MIQRTEVAVGRITVRAMRKDERNTRVPQYEIGTTAIDGSTQVGATLWILEEQARHLKLGDKLLVAIWKEEACEDPPSPASTSTST